MVYNLFKSNSNIIVLGDRIDSANIINLRVNSCANITIHDKCTSLFFDTLNLYMFAFFFFLNAECLINVYPKVRKTEDPLARGKTREIHVIEIRRN